ncbi:SH3 domain-containing kinase-binding protein 1-like, partial [Ruditapes philippinarum]|uniref:SH3 domain-containing kinase-binding protein 1-like n=1 Tax=Ruditapes philippinarum TaxID=129788 RepID=UPI00295AED55
MSPPPTEDSETKPQSKLADKIPADTEQSKPGPLKETKAMKFKAIVKYSYEAKHKDELTQTKGDTRNSLDKDLEESGCWKGELNGQICVFQDNYVEIIKEE